MAAIIWSAQTLMAASNNGLLALGPLLRIGSIFIIVGSFRSNIRVMGIGENFFYNNFVGFLRLMRLGICLNGKLALLVCFGKTGKRLLGQRRGCLV
jgi:hypothetical protein